MHPYIPITFENAMSNTDQFSCMPSPRGAATAACTPLPRTRARGSSDRTLKCDGYRIIYAGTPEFSVPALAALLDDPRFEIIAVLTQPDRPAGRGQKLHASPVKNFALAHHIPLFQPLNLKDAEIQNIVRALKPDAMIVAAYGLILPPELLTIPKKGCINIHGSLLPKWRGAAPVQRAIEQGDATTGISIMQMEKGLDTGPVFLMKTCPITLEDNGSSLMMKLAHLGAEALLEALPELCNGTLQATPQNNLDATYAKKLEKTEGLLDWQEEATTLARRIRAFTPWPGCYFMNHDQRIKVGSAYAAPIIETYKPGTILKKNAQEIIIACGKDALCLTQIQLPGGKMGAPGLSSRGLTGFTV